MRTYTMTRDRKKMLGIEFSQHQITKELVVSLCSSGGPAAKSGIEVGDRVLSIQVSSSGRRAVKSRPELVGRV